MSLSQQEARLQMGQKPPTLLVLGLLLKAENAGDFSQRMTKEENNIQQTGGGKKKQKKNFVVVSLFIAVCGKTVLWRALARLHHKAESS